MAGARGAVKADPAARIEQLRRRIRHHDYLYYVLDRKPMPESLPWLANNPLIHGIRRDEVIASVVFWLAVLVILYAVLYLRRRSGPILPVGPHDEGIGYSNSQD